MAPRHLQSLIFAFVLSSHSAFAGSAETLPGWDHSPPEDAVMAVGQRFDCVGAECGTGFSCLHAVAPPRPAASRWLKPSDVTNAKVWPWKAVEAWLGTKLNVLMGRPVVDPSEPASRWAETDDPVVFEVAGETFARRIYLLESRSLTIPIWFWTSKGRLFTLFCAIEGGRLASARAPIHRLLSRLHPGEPAREDIPERF